MHDRSCSKLLRALLPLLAATGCDGCPSAKPYTPYTLGSAAPSVSPPPLSGARPAEGDAGAAPGDAGLADAAAPPRFTAVPSVPAPEGGKRWPLDGGAVAAAPTGRTFETGLLLDVDGDGARDLVAWARSPDGLRGELLFAAATRPDAPRTLAALPGDLAPQGCTARAGLTQIGPATLAFDFAPQCGAQRSAELPATRWIAVIRLPGTAAGAPPELALELRLRTPPPDESLSASFEVADRDADGRDDLAIAVGLSGALRPFPAPPAAAPELRAPLVFLDRPAGLSRDAAQPGEALRALAASVLRDARAKSTAPAAATAAQRLRRLHAVLCADAASGAGAVAGRDAARAGEGLVSTGAGPVRCAEPGLAAAIDHAEAVAAQTRGAPLAAVAALDRGGPEPRTKDEGKLLAKLAPPATAAAVHRTAAAPQPGALGPLAFEAGGALLVRTAQGVVRVDPATFGEAAADVPPWPAALLAGPVELVGVERRCDAPTLLALVRSSPDAVGEMEVPLPLLRGQGPRARRGAAAPERCAGTERLPFAPLAASEAGFDVALGAALISIDLRAAAPVASALSFPLATPAPQGAARSPDGATIAVPAAGGVLVATAGGATRLWSGGDIAQGTACVPASGGARVACVVGASAVIYEAK
ncbi:hypothetical protein SOCE26_106400 [Sorangium cellulosum]|uniref:Uncharacterized protein n=1 Tax=Sorangium cellulosum TaxID=56 RepID=A0A2L0FBW3_SORCE|nr:hypothetical protein [Sorangium cellulosum]AUX49095.1 hypothetical protein SOCE26_106400 [Sorangium cellulosum]